jgi:hypothetical protein
MPETLDDRPACGRGRGDAGRGVRSLTVIVDTNVIVAVADQADRDNERCLELL